MLDGRVRVALGAVPRLGTAEQQRIAAAALGEVIAPCARALLARAALPSRERGAAIAC